MKFYLINENGASVIDIPNTNEAINKALKFEKSYGGRNTGSFTIFGYPNIAIVCDLGKVIGLPISAIPTSVIDIGPDDNIPEPFFVGPTLIGKFDGIDDFITLSDKDIERLKQVTVSTNGYERTYKQIIIIDKKH